MHATSLVVVRHRYHPSVSGYHSNEQSTVHMSYELKVYNKSQTRENDLFHFINSMTVSEK
jgi:hypothetical protein